jgi:hypothetical protein
MIRATMLVLLLSAAPLGAEELPGFTISPPAGGHWREVQRNATSLVWMRRTADRDTSFGVAVLSSRLSTRFDDDGFLDWVKRSKSANPDPRRFEIIESSYAADAENAARCVRYRTVIEDRTLGTLLQVAGLACLHPDDAQRYFDVQYSARYPMGVTLAGDLIAEGDAFVEGFRFTAPPADGDWSMGSGDRRDNRQDAA